MAVQPVFSGIGSQFVASRVVFQEFDPPILVFDSIPLINAGISAGTSLARLDDVDGDGVPDLAVGAPAFVIRAEGGSFSPGAVFVLSGATLDTLRIIDRVGFPNDLGAPTSVDELRGTVLGGLQGGIGGTLISLGDVDGDGRDDLLLGNPWDDVLVPGGGLAIDAGRYWVVFGRPPEEEGDGLLQAVDITGLDPSKPSGIHRFGTNTANLGDLDGDGVADFAIVSSGNINFIDVRSGATLDLLYRVQGPASGPSRGSRIGEAVTTIGDIDGDGIPDFALGDSIARDPSVPVGQFPPAGSVSLHSGADGAVIRSVFARRVDALNSNVQAREFGTEVVALGDVNGDGVADFAVGAPGSFSRPNATVPFQQTGLIVVYSGADGAILSMRPGGAGQPRFGTDIASVGDLDGDGVADILAPVTGGVVALSGTDLREIGRIVAPEGSSAFGAAITLMGDLDGDGFPEIALGAPGRDELAGLGRGGVFIVSLAPLERLAETPSFDFAGPPVRLTDSLSVINPQANFINFRTGTFHPDLAVTLERAGGAAAGDVFGFDFTGKPGTLRLSEDGSRILGFGDGRTFAVFTSTEGRLTISFLNSADARGVPDEVVQDILRSITYRNTEAAPPASLDLVWTVQGRDGATTRLQSVSITGAPAGPDPEPPAPLPTLLVTAPLSVVEGTAVVDDPDEVPGRIVYTLTLSEAAAFDIRVTYDLLAGGTGAEFVTADDLLSPVTGSLIIAAGATVASLVVLVNPDALAEPDERLAPALTAMTVEATPRVVGVGPVPQVLVEDDDTPAGGGDPGGGGPGGGGPGGGGPGGPGDGGDDEGGPAPVTILLSGPARLAEGDSGETVATFVIALAEAATAPVRVDWTLTGSAGPADLAPGTPRAGSVLFAPGEVTAAIPVRILGDRVVERDETLVLAVTGAEAGGGLALAPLPAAFTTEIANDDRATLSITGASVVEGNVGSRLLPFALALSNPVDVPVEVTWSLQTAGAPALADAADFTPGQPLEGRVVFQPGQVSATVLVSVRGDNVVEPDERVRLVVDRIEAYGRDVTDGTSVTDGLILNDDALVVSLLSEDRTFSEPGGAAGIGFEVGLRRAGADGGPMAALEDIVVGWQLIPGGPGLASVGADDFVPDTPFSGTLTIAAGQSSATVTLALLDDTIAERVEGFSVLLTGAAFASGAAVALDDVQARVRVEDDDAAVVSVRPTALAVLEGTAPDARSVEYVFTRTGDTSRTVTLDWAVDVLVGPPVLRRVERIVTKTDPETGVSFDARLVFFEPVTQAETFSNTLGARVQLEREVKLNFLREETDPSASFGVPAPEPEYQLLRLPESLRSFNVSFSNPLLDVELVGQLDGGLYLVLDNPSPGQFAIAVTRDGGIVMPNYVLPGQVFILRPEAYEQGATTAARVAVPSFDGLTLEARVAVSGPTGLRNLTLRDLTGEEILRFQDELLVPLTNGDGSPLRIKLLEVTKEDDLSFTINDIAKELGAQGIEDLPDIIVVPSLPAERVTNLSDTVTILDKTSAPVTFLALRTDAIDWLPYVNPLFNLASIEYSLEDFVSRAAEPDQDPDRFDLTKIGSAEASLKLLSWQLDLGIGFVMDVYFKADPVVVEVEVEGRTKTNTAGAPFSFVAPDAAGSILDGEVRWIQRGELEITWRLAPTAAQRWEGPTLSLEAEFSDAIRLSLEALGIEPPTLEYKVDWRDRLDQFAGLEIVDEVAFDPALYAFTVNVADYELSRVVTPFSIPVLDPFNTPLAGRLTFAPGETSLTVRLPILPDTRVEPNVTAIMRITDVASDDGAVVNVARAEAETRIVDDDGQVFEWWTLGGDPHLETPDGLAYDFHAAGEFVLARATDGSGFALQARFEPLEGSDLVSVTTAIALLVDGRRVTFSLDTPGFAAVDGTAVNLAPLETITLGDGLLTFDGTTWFVATEAADVLAVRAFADFIDMGFAPAAGRAGRLQGLLGNHDGDPTNDLALPDGTPLGTAPAFGLLYGAFADAWRVGPADTLFDYAPGEGPGTFARPGLPRGALALEDLPAALVAAATEAVDRLGITDPVRRANAIFDFALTGDADYLQSAVLLAADAGAGVALQALPTGAPALGGFVGARAVLEAAAEEDAARFGLAFTIWRAGDLSGAGEVAWTLGGDVDAADLGAAQAGSGIVAFAPGQAEAVILVALRDDDLPEADEVLSLRITSADFLIAAPVARTLVLDDDGPAPDPAAARRLGGPGNDILVGGPGADWLLGLGGGDTLLGLGGPDRLEGGPGDDTLDGGEGDDRLVGGPGADMLLGGAGTDTAVYGGRAGVTVNLALGTGSGGEAEGDTLTGVENVTGTRFDDALTGDAGANRLVGGAGADLLDGGAGDDRLWGGPGADILIGGDGVDTAVYGGLVGVTVNLALGTGMGGEAEGDLLFGIENLVGTVADDVLIGDAGANRLLGNAGNDTLIGGGGNDTLIGGAGDDLLVFRFGDAPGRARVIGFDQEGDDAVWLEGFAAFATFDDVAAALEQRGGDVWLTLGPGSSVVFLDTQRAGFTAADFLFA